MFVDQIEIAVKGGDGGNGCRSFRREKFVPFGGADGGDGGDGGAVILKAVESEQSLQALYYLRHYEGGRGEHGRGKGQHGARGETRVVDVPVGTLVYSAEELELLCDLVEAGQEFIAAKPGRGGRGNARFVNSTRQAPMFAEEGRPAQERTLFLDLKCIADIGLVGYPNAGKSTLLNKVSAAHPKTAPYPFTTLHPNVGIVEFPDFYRMSIADIPGLIDGAHENKGLGHNFLKHIERCRVLVYVVDIAATDQREPVDDLKALMRELDAYQEGLSKRAKIVLANKVDDDVELFDDEIALLREHTDLPVMPVSSQTGYNCDEFCQGIRQLLLREKAIETERYQSL